MISLPFRLMARLVTDSILKNILPRLDCWLGPETVCSGYMVLAIRE